MKMSELIRIGIGYVPADRAEGLFPDLSVRENLGLAARIGRIAPSRTVEEVMKLLAIRAHDLRDPVKELSGGNQQKVLIGRWLVTAVQALILVEPTRGVDIGVRVDIHRLIRELADIGVGILLASLDTEEIEAVANRVLVMHNGRIYTELEGKITVSKVRTAVAGVASTKATNV
jgi:ribose transport system ATP-binding protein